MSQAILTRSYRALVNRIPRPLKLAFFKITTSKGSFPEYVCPLCSYNGPFQKVNGEGGLRIDAECPSCGSRERHRLLYLVLNKVRTQYDLNKLSLLHSAPEAQLRKLFRNLFNEYVTIDLSMPDVDHHDDLCNMPFPDHRFDFIIASHVLEHIKDDLAALREIRRVLKPGGIALLPVPVSGEKTIEFDQVNIRAYGHVRSPGIDYFERYRKIFKQVEVHSSDDYPKQNQTALYERKNGPKGNFIRRLEFVPVCYE